MSQGYYYLIKDVEINGTWQAPNGVNLCLNGYRIIETGDVDAIKVNNGNIFTLCDDLRRAGHGEGDISPNASTIRGRVFGDAAAGHIERTPVHIHTTAES